MQNDNVLVRMIRENLEAIPQFSLPPNYTMRLYQPGDERWWLEIQAAADRYNSIAFELFAEQFGKNQQQITERQLYLCGAHNMAIGTATAWFKNDYQGEPYGRVHWVAIKPKWQSLGLAKPLMTATCQRLRELGHNRVYLTTSTARIPAINLYLQFGFEPQINTADDMTAWQASCRTESISQSIYQIEGLHDPTKFSGHHDRPTAS